MELLQKIEIEKQQKMSRDASKTKSKYEPGPSSVQLTDQDLTSGLLDVKSTWTTEPIVKYDSSSDED